MINQLPWPVDWPAEFGRQAPLHVEIGFGSGQYLVRLAKERPDLNLVGMEVSRPSLRNAARKVARDGLGNVRLLQSSARTALWLLFVAESVEAAYIHFPDPWPKKGHHSRRVIEGDFLSLLATRMVPQGPLDISTDHAAYMEVIGERLAASSYFDSRLPVAYVQGEAARINTKYERFALGEGREPAYFRWQRNDSPAADQFSLPEEFAMPHIIVRTPATLAGLGQRFEPASLEEDGMRIKYLELFQSLNDGRLLVDTFVSEDPLVQRFGISMRARTSGDILIELHEAGNPRPTRGVQMAVQGLADWIIRLYPATVVVQSNVRVIE